MASASFGNKTRLAGKKFRGGPLGDAITDTYHDIEEAFVTVEALATGSTGKVLSNIVAASVADYNLAGTIAAVDGVTPAIGGLVLLVAQSLPKENGLYRVNSLAAAGLGRYVGYDALDELTEGDQFQVNAGGTNHVKASTWVLMKKPATLGTDAMYFAKKASLGVGSQATAAGSAIMEIPEAGVNGSISKIILQPVAALTADRTVTIPDFDANLGIADCGDGSDGPIVFDGTNSFAGGGAWAIANANAGGPGALTAEIGAAPDIVYTLIRDLFATTVEVSANKTLVTGGFGIFATTSVSVLAGGTLNNNGFAGGVNGGAGGTAGRYAGGGAGGAGKSSGQGAGTKGVDTINSPAGDGGAGGNDGTGNAGGAIGNAADVYAANYNQGGYRTRPQTILAATLGSSGFTRMGGGAGGGGGGADINGTAGQGGGGGGVVVIAAPVIRVSATGSITSNGGNGQAATVANAGGGGTGGGGLVLLNYRALDSLGTISAAAGSVVGTPEGTGAAGTLGVAGKVIKVLL